MRSVTKKCFQACLRWFLTYRTKSKYTNWEVERHLLNLWDSEHWTHVFLVSPSHKTITLTLTLTSTCQVVRCHGDYLLCFQIVTSTSLTIYRGHVLVRYYHLPTTLAELTRSSHLTETYLLCISVYCFCKRSAWRQDVNQAADVHLHMGWILFYIPSCCACLKKIPAELLGETEVLVLPGGPEAISIPVTCCTTESMLAGCGQRQRPPTRHYLTAHQCIWRTHVNTMCSTHAFKRALLK